MSIKDKINNYRIMRKTNKLSVEDKIEYLSYLNKKGINIMHLDDNYVSEDKILVSNVIINIYKNYSKSKLTIKQIIACEDLGFQFERASNVEDKIKFLQKAVAENLDLSYFISDYESNKNRLVFKYICDIRKANKMKKLTSKQLSICISELKIIINDDEIKQEIFNKLENSTLKHIMLYQDILDNLSS